MTSMLHSISHPAESRQVPFGRLVSRVKETGRSDLEPLSVYLEDGVVPRASRGDNYNRLGEDLDKYLVVRPGDLVFNKLRTWQGGLGVSRYQGIVSPAYFVCRPHARVDPRYLHYLLRSRPYLAEFARISKFMPPSQFDILWEDLRSVPVQLPPIETQAAIADYLDAETGRIDALIEKRRQVADRLTERFESDVFSAVTRGLRGAALAPSGLAWAPEIPSTWGRPTAGSLFDVQLGKMLNAHATAGSDQCPYVRNLNVQWDRVDLTDLATMHFSPVERIRFSLKAGDLLVCEGGEVGRAAIWQDDSVRCFYQKAVHRLRPLRGANVRFMMYALRAAAKMNVFAVEGNLSTIVHLTREQLRSHRFPWPGEEEQREIVAYLDAAAGAQFELRMRTTEAVALLHEHRQALITAAVTGELDISGAA